MLLILLYGNRFSESDTAAVTVYAKFKERGINANLVLSDLTTAGKYGYYYEDFFDGMKEVLFSRNEDMDVCIVNIPYIYHPSLRSGHFYAEKQKDNIVYTNKYIDLRRRVIDLFEEDGHDILEYMLLPDEDNTKVKVKLSFRDAESFKDERLAEEEYREKHPFYDGEKEFDCSHCIYDIPNIYSNPIQWNKIFEEAVCVLQGWDSFGI